MELYIYEKDFHDMITEWIEAHYEVKVDRGSLGAAVIYGTQREPGDVLKVTFQIAKKSSDLPPGIIPLRD